MLLGKLMLFLGAPCDGRVELHCIMVAGVFPFSIVLLIVLWFDLCHESEFVSTVGESNTSN